MQVAIRPELTEHLVTTGDIGMPRTWLTERFPEVQDRQSLFVTSNKADPDASHAVHFCTDAIIHGLFAFLLRMLERIIMRGTLLQPQLPS